MKIIDKRIHSLYTCSDVHTVDFVDSGRRLMWPESRGKRLPFFLPVRIHLQ